MNDIVYSTCPYRRTPKTFAREIATRKIVIYAANGIEVVCGQNSSTDTAAVISAGMHITHYGSRLAIALCSC